MSFEVRAGEILGVIGPNGAGKSTLFNLITGMLASRTTAASCSSTTTSSDCRRAISPPGDRPHLPAREAAPQHDAARQRRCSGPICAPALGLLAGALRLDRAEEGSAPARGAAADRARRPRRKAGELAGNLPLGQQRSLEVARALAADPLVVLLDEPAAGLRHLEKQALADLLRTLRNEGVSILLVEHDMDFVMNLVDRIVVMDFGAKIAKASRPRSEPTRACRKPTSAASHDALLGGRRTCMSPTARSRRSSGVSARCRPARSSR